MQLISIVIPVFNEQENISPVCKALDQYVKQHYEVIFVDDGSTDNSFLEIKQQSGIDDRIKCISFSRNFGHQNALMAGMEYCKGNIIVLMDGDLQHPPSLVPQMIRLVEEGYDLVNTKRKLTQNIGAVKSGLSTLFYRFINFISETKIEEGLADFRAFNRKVLESVLAFKERELFLRGLFSWIGFKHTTIDFEAPARQYGQTKYSFSRMMKLGLKGTTSFSFKPLRLALLVGSIVSLAAFAFAVYALVVFYQGKTVPGWASMIIAIMLLGGTQLLALGLLGEYIASLFIETKKRPLYLVDKTIKL